jgi:hypothetical protein
MNKLSAVRLIAPRDMIPITARVWDITMAYAGNKDRARDAADVRNQLLTAMRADLGEAD